jgi:4-hydroxy-4-methyl-2-oxoglutarate aldolase
MVDESCQRRLCYIDFKRTNDVMNAAPAFLSELAAKLTTIALADVLDAQGLRCQALPPSIRPLKEGSFLCGFARTGLFRPVFHVAQNSPAADLEEELISSLKGGEVVVLASAGAVPMTTLQDIQAQKFKEAGAAGFLSDGLVRGVKHLRSMDEFSVFSSGSTPLDGRGRGELAAIDVPIELGNIRIQKGDFLFGDEDGVVVVPKALVTQVIALAIEKQQSRAFKAPPTAESLEESNMVILDDGMMDEVDVFSARA